LKILIVRFSSIGDIVLTSPIVRCLKQQLDGVEIHYLSKKKFSSILTNNPYIDKIHLIDKSITEVVKTLKTEQYDFVVDLHNNIRTKSLTYRLKVPFKRFPKLHLQKWLYVKAKKDVLPNIHVVERYFQTVTKLGVTSDNLPCDYFLSPEEEVNTEKTFQLTPKKYIGFAIGAQFATKRLPLHKIIEICSKIEFPIVLLGGKEDREIGEKIITSTNNNILNLCGELTLNQSASVVQQAAALITHDTGLMHIASAFNIPIISVWGNTTPRLGMYPYVPNKQNTFSIHEVKNLSCRPCSKIGFQSCPKKDFKCMELQNVEEISNEVLTIIKRYS
jgi:lipopolysaccharide heptosyltransferase II